MIISDEIYKENEKNSHFCLYSRNKIKIFQQDVFIKYKISEKARRRKIFFPKPGFLHKICGKIFYKTIDNIIYL